jgi:hypothetical protein
MAAGLGGQVEGVIVSGATHKMHSDGFGTKLLSHVFMARSKLSNDG